MKKIFLTFTLLFTLQSIVMSQDVTVLNSDKIPWPDSVLTITPSSYKYTAKAYPTIFMLHGWSGNYLQWSQITNLQKYADEYDFVIVCPDGFFESWYLDSPVMKNWQYSTFFFNNLIPALKDKYRIDTTKMFITGLSMGGHGALHLFFTNPDKFCGAGSTSGVVDLRNNYCQSIGLGALLGEMATDTEIYYKYSAVYNVEKIKNSKKKFIFDCGQGDVFHEMNQKFYEQCIDMGINAKFISQPGIHDYNYWALSIKAHFDFFRDIVDNSIEVKKLSSWAGGMKIW